MSGHPDDEGRGALLRRTRLPFQRFFRAESASGTLLLATAVVALGWANSPWAEAYFRLWEVEVSVGAEALGLTLSLQHWINDGLMVAFFFLVGLEIKREILVGELASVRQAALPIAAALGGMLVPAGIYMLLNAGTAAERGWGIPMATDIAFALGVLALLGKRVPIGLKVFLAALAIVDDLGAVIVIALFYTGELAWNALGLAGIVLVALIIINRLDVRHPGPYALLGIVLWLAFLRSGVHATLAGVVLAMTIPARTRIDAKSFVALGRAYLDEFEAAGAGGRRLLPTPAQQAALRGLEQAAEDVQAPLQRIEHGLQAWVSFGIIPLFALANAGVAVIGNLAASLTHPVALGVALGLLIGKPIGILCFTWLAIRTGLAVPPAGVGTGHLVGVSLLGGIGFTMSLFIANLAFGTTDALAIAKIGILSASTVAGIAGLTVLRAISPRPTR
jgi:NhaA family Na+:H+ antiporter